VIVINMFLELGLPFILRFINDWRAGKTTVKEAVEKVKNVKNGIQSEKEDPVPSSAEEAESLFMEKVERELGLPEYNLFSKSYLHTSSFTSPINLVHPHLMLSPLGEAKGD